MSQKVALDNDFLQHLAETQGEASDVRLMIQKFFQELDYEPLLHELVHKNEVMKEHPVIKQLLTYKDIEVVQLFSAGAICSSPAQQKYYRILVESIYKEMTGKEYPVPENIKKNSDFSAWLSAWQRGKSLGEVHCIVLCYQMNLSCLLSDDREARDLRGIIKRKFSRCIPVFSRKDCQQSLQEKKLHNLTRKELRCLCHQNV